MYVHANAKLGLAGRFALVRAVEDGRSLREAAAAFSISPATAHRWWHRWLEAGEEARRTLSCLLDRSSRQKRSHRQLAPEFEQAICARRRDTGWGPRLVAGATGFAHSTVWKVLRRAGMSRAPRAAMLSANRYEWPCPGDLLHMDVSRYARFLQPGHRVTGDRSQSLRGAIPRLSVDPQRVMRSPLAGEQGGELVHRGLQRAASSSGSPQPVTADGGASQAPLPHR